MVQQCLKVLVLFHKFPFHKYGRKVGNKGGVYDDSEAGGGVEQIDEIGGGSGRQEMQGPVGIAEELQRNKYEQFPQRKEIWDIHIFIRTDIYKGTKGNQVERISGGPSYKNSGEGCKKGDLDVD